MSKLLIVDDETRFRETLSQRLNMRGFTNEAVGDGIAAVQAVRGDPEIDVVILDRKMPGPSGEQVLRDIRQYRPEIRVIFLTGHGDLDSAMEVGKLEAYAYLEKPCDLDRLVATIGDARADVVHARARHEIPNVEKGSLLKWLIGSQNSRPGVILLGVLLFAGITLMPAPQRMVQLLSAPKADAAADIHLGYAYYRDLAPGETISAYYADHYKVGDKVRGNGTSRSAYRMDVIQAARRAQVMLATLVVAALFWASGAVPIGITALFVGVAMYFLGVLRPDDVAKAYAKDAVIFIFGVLAMARAINRTGLDRRIGLLLLGPAKSLPRYMFIFLPLFGMACSFLSEHALVAFLVPMLMMVYATSTQEAGVRKDPALAVMLILSLNFAANCGGPGSPAAGGRNAIMIGILADYGVAPTFGQWVQYGLPFVPVMGLVIAAYFYLSLRGRIKTRALNISSIVHRASDKIGPMNSKEYITAAVLVGLIALWVTCSDTLGMGGPVILALVVLNVLRIMRWQDVASIHWEVVALYASACALGKGLAVTGAALYIADGFIGLLPDFLTTGEGLAISAAVFTGLTTNFMSDGAT
ncbi:anion permease, partial [bacterium]|nr:anion permease [bacterium]